MTPDKLRSIAAHIDAHPDAQGEIITIAQSYGANAGRPVLYLGSHSGTALISSLREPTIADVKHTWSTRVTVTGRLVDGLTVDVIVERPRAADPCECSTLSMSDLLTTEVAA